MITTDTDLIYDAVLDELNSEVYDLCNDFQDEEIADFVSKLYTRINAAANGSNIADLTLRNDTYKYLVRVSNNIPNAFVSVSNDESTAVSSSLYYVFDLRDEDYSGQVRNLLAMLNEAYYECIND